jgi:hypothetical protein
LRLRRRLYLLCSVTAVVVAMASTATAQEPRPPFDLPSQVAAIPNTTVGYRLSDQAVVAVVGDMAVVSDAEQTSLQEAIWTKEPVRFRFVEVQYAGVKYRRSYDELRDTFGRRPAGLEKQSLQELADQVDRAGAGTDNSFTWLKTAVFAVVVGVVTVMLVVVLFVLVSVQWRRARARKAAPDDA